MRLPTCWPVEWLDNSLDWLSKDKITVFTDCLTNLLITRWPMEWLDYCPDWLFVKMTGWLGDWFDWSLVPLCGFTRLLNCASHMYLHKGCILNLSCITSSGLRKDVQKWKNDWNKTDTFHIGDKAFFLVDKNIIIMRLLIHFFHIDHFAPCSPSEILPNGCTQEKLETMVMQNFGDKQGVLWTMWEWWL